VLVCTPLPKPTESFFGFILRVSEANGYNTPKHIFNYAGYKHGNMQSTIYNISPLVKILGKKIGEIESISLSTIKKGKSVFKVLNHNIGTRSPADFLRLTKPMICTQCILEEKYIDIFFDLDFAVACPKHQCRLLSQCPSCERDLQWFRPGLSRCSCGASLVSSSVNPANIQVVELMGILKAKLHDKPILNLPNTSGYPMKELDNLTLLSFIWIISKIGSFAFYNKEMKDRYYFIKEVSAALSEWPSGYYKFLHQLGMKLMNDGNPSSIGLRKQFEPFYTPMFDSRFITQNDSNFLRNEWIKFGCQIWGNAIVSEKLLNYLDDDTEVCFFSMSKIIRDTGINPVKLRSLLQNGKIPSKKLLINNDVRYILDKQSVKSILEIESLKIKMEVIGKTLNKRDAAKFLQLPVSVLSSLRESGYYISEYMPKNSPDFHETDLLSFSLTLLKKSTLTTEEIINTISCFSLAYILEEKRFWSKKGKAEFVTSYLDGNNPSVGRTGCSTNTIWFDKEGVENFLCKSRSKSCKKTITQKDAATIIDCSLEVVLELIKSGNLIGQAGPSRNRVTQESIKKFTSLYLSISSIAKEFNTSSRRLHRLCRESKVNLLYMPRKKKGVVAFILRKKRGVLIDLIEQNPTREQKRKVINQIKVESIIKLKSYFYNLRKSNTCLPRRKKIPLKSQISKTCGVSNSIFYHNQEAIDMLEKFDLEDRLRIGIEKRDDIGDLHRYLDKLKKNGGMNSQLKKVPPNKKAIADGCGISRQIFYSNTKAKDLFDRYVNEMLALKI